MAVNSYTNMTDAYNDISAREVLPRDIMLPYLREGGYYATPLETRFMVANVAKYDTPVRGDNIRQETFGDTTYVVRDFDGYIHPEEVADMDMWEWLRDDQAIVLIPTMIGMNDGPHSGITSEYSGVVVEEPYYVVTWTDSDDTPTVVQGAWDGLEAFFHEVTDTHDEENGWMLYHAEVVSTIPDGDTAPTMQQVTIHLYGNGNVTTVIHEWKHDKTGLLTDESYLHEDWKIGDHDDPNSPIETFMSMFNPEGRLMDISNIQAFVEFTREDFSGRFTVAVDRYEG